MTDPIWQELLRSPLEPDPNEEPSILGWLVPAGLAAAVGLSVGLFFGASNAPDPTPTTVAAAIATTAPATSTPPPDPILPDGYVDAGAIGMRALASYSDGENLFVVVSQAVRSDLDPTETDSQHLAKWTLAGDGFDVVATRSFESITSPGTRVVEFPSLISIPTADPHLVVTRATPMEARVGCNGCAAISQNTANR